MQPLPSDDERVNVKGFAEFAEPWCAGFCAARDDATIGDDPQRFMDQLYYDWRMSGSELAKRAMDDTLSDEDRDKIEHMRRFG